MDMSIKPKRGGMSRLPGRHKLSSDGVKSKNENIVRFTYFYIYTCMYYIRLHSGQYANHAMQLKNQK